MVLSIGGSECIFIFGATPRICKPQSTNPRKAMAECMCYGGHDGPRSSSLVQLVQAAGEQYEYYSGSQIILILYVPRIV